MRLIVKSNQNMTPKSCDKTVFHLVLAPKDQTCLDYHAGDWLTVQACNQDVWVQAILNALALTGDETLELRRVGRVTVKEALTAHLEISQLNPAILNKLQRQHQMGEWSDRQAMMDAAYGRDVLDLFEMFPALTAWGLEFISLLSPLAPRYYSIASAPIAVGNEVHLVVKQVVYRNPLISERTHYGVASYAISHLKPGQEVECELKRNPTFQLPEDSTTPIIMLGAGTGIAPYIGFLQQRIADNSAGENILIFGETRQACSFLFGEFLTDCVAQQHLTLFTAFSRDQTEKIYVQNRIREQADLLWRAIQQGAHIYICGSQFGLAEDVKTAWLGLIMHYDQVDLDVAEQTWQAWRKQKRLQMDVY